jgi:hypothetical protein
MVVAGAGVATGAAAGAAVAGAEEGTVAAAGCAEAGAGVGDGALALALALGAVALCVVTAALAPEAGGFADLSTEADGAAAVGAFAEAETPIEP